MHEGLGVLGVYKRSHLLMRTLTAGSTLFRGDLGRRLALRLPPLVRFPDNSVLCGLASNNGGSVFVSVLFGQVCSSYCSSFGSPLRSGWVHHICSISGPLLAVRVLPQPLRPVPCCLLSLMFQALASNSSSPSLLSFKDAHSS